MAVETQPGQDTGPWIWNLSFARSGALLELERASVWVVVWLMSTGGTQDDVSL